MNLFEAIFNPANGERIAILFEQQAITYDALREDTVRLISVLRKLEIEPGDRVALLLNDSPEFVAAFIAICAQGAIVVPINTGLAHDQQRAILDDCTARAAFVEEDIAAAFTFEQSAPALTEIIAVRRSSTTGKQGEQLKAFAGSRKRVWDLSEMLSDCSEETAEPLPGKKADQPAFIFYTSGSTGEPKGAVHREADAFYVNETYCSQVLKVREGDRLFSSSRLPFSYGFGNAFCFPLLNGCTTILCREKPTPEVIRNIFATHQPTIFFGVPVIYRLLLDHHFDVAPINFSSLRLCVSAGEALPAALGEEIQQTFGVPVLDGIGSTEMFHMWMSNFEGDLRYGSSGKLLEGYEARLIDQEGKSTPKGTEGNLWVKGDSAALGYWEKPEVTAATFVDGWVRTGDLYQQDADGFWFHMGRSDDCFKSSGQWVSPVEVEGVLLKDAGVNHAAVVQDFDENNLPCACAFIVKANVGQTNEQVEQKLRVLARASLPRFKQPRRYVFIDDLPYTATGKVQRYKLRESLKQSPRSNAQGVSSS